MTGRLTTKFLQFLPNNKFFKNITVLLGGAAGGQLLLLLAAPFLTRLYSPDDFGLLAVYVAILNISSSISSLKYEMAIPLPEKDIETANIVGLSLCLVLCTSVLTAFAVFVFGEQVGILFSVPDLVGIIWLLPVGVFLVGGYSIFHYVALRFKVFGSIALTRLQQSLMTIIVQLFAFKVGGGALIFGHTAGQGVGVLKLYKESKLNLDLRDITLKGMLSAAVRFKNFPLFATWSALFNSAGRQLPALMFAAFFSSGAAGIYVLAERVLAAPVSLVGQAVANVFLPNAVEANRDGKMGGLVAKIHNYLAQIAMPVAILIAVAGPDLFAIIFGEEWRQAGDFSRWLSVCLYAAFVTSPISMVFSILEKQNISMYLQGFLFFVRLMAILFGAFQNDLMLSVILYSVGSAVCYLLFTAIAFYVSSVSLSLMIKSSLSAFLISIICFTPLIMLPKFFDGSFIFWLGLLLSISLTVIRLFFLFRNSLGKLC